MGDSAVPVFDSEAISNQYLTFEQSSIKFWMDNRSVLSFEQSSFEFEPNIILVKAKMG